MKRYEIFRNGNRISSALSAHDARRLVKQLRRNEKRECSFPNTEGISYISPSRITIRDADSRETVTRITSERRERQDEAMRDEWRSDVSPANRHKID